jgi:hypothetical protein
MPLRQRFLCGSMKCQVFSRCGACFGMGAGKIYCPLARVRAVSFPLQTRLCDGVIYDLSDECWRHSQSMPKEGH